MTDQEQEGMQKMQKPANFDGPVKNRKCTDILCSVMLFAMWTGMTYVGISAVTKGDYRVIINPMDYDGNICGIDDKGRDMTNYPKLVYVNNLAGGVCVKECPHFESLIDVHTFITYDGVWQGDKATLPENYVEVADYTYSENVLFKTCTDDLCPTDTDPEESFTSDGIKLGTGFATYAVSTFDTFGGRCIADPKALKKIKEQVTTVGGSITEFDAFDKGQKYMNRLFSDLYISRYYLVMTFGIAMAVGLSYSLLLRIPLIVSTMVWGSIFLTIAMFFGVGIVSFMGGRKLEDEEPQKAKSEVFTAMKVIGGIFGVLGGILVLITLFLRKQIKLAITCVKESARAIGSMPLIILLPIVETLAFLGFFCVTLFYAVHLASTGTRETIEQSGVSVRVFKYDDSTAYSGLFLLFCFFWTSALMSALGSIMVSMSVSKWYFTRDKSLVCNSIVLKSVLTTLFYHIGTAAFGSLLIAIIQIIRYLIAKLQKYAKKADSKVANALLCCCQCCFYCFEMFMKFINKNAYIQTAIFGTSFCKSAREGFFLILRNILRVGSIGYVSTLVVFVGKLFISIMSTGIGFMVLEQQVGSELNNIYFPLIFVFIISYFVADMFMDLFDMSTSTILQCFIADEEMFPAGERFIDGNTKQFLDDFEKSKKNIVDDS